MQTLSSVNETWQQCYPYFHYDVYCGISIFHPALQQKQSQSEASNKFYPPDIFKMCPNSIFFFFPEC